MKKHNNINTFCNLGTVAGVIAIGAIVLSPNWIITLIILAIALVVIGYCDTNVKRIKNDKN